VEQTPELEERRRRRMSAQKRNELLARYKASNLTQKEFASQESIPLSTLTYWLRRLRASSNSFSSVSAEQVSFKEVSLPQAVLGSGPWVAEISMGNGRTLRLGAEAPDGLVQNLLRLLSC
jgi:hypothetical protein